MMQPTKRTVRSQAGSFLLCMNDYSAGWTDDEHAHSTPYISFVLQGCYSEWQDGSMELRSAGTAHFHPAGARKYGRVGQGGALCLSVVLMDTGYRQFRTEVSNLNDRLGKDLSEIRDGIVDGIKKSSEARHLESLSERLLGVINGTEPLPPSWLQLGAELLRTKERRPIDSIAAEVGVHPVYFWQSFRSWFGCSPGAFARDHMVQRSKSMLLESELSIAEIAADVGFSDQSHLTRVFRAITGETPAQFRRRSKP